MSETLDVHSGCIKSFCADTALQITWFAVFNFTTSISTKFPQKGLTFDTFLFRHINAFNAQYVSILPTGANKPGDVDPKLLCPVFDVFMCWLPSSIRDRLRCGIDYSKVSLDTSLSILKRSCIYLHPCFKNKRDLNPFCEATENWPLVTSPQHIKFPMTCMLCCQNVPFLYFANRGRSNPRTSN